MTCLHMVAINQGVMLGFCVFKIAHGISSILHIIQKSTYNSYPCNKFQLYVYMGASPLG